jgi:peptidoglycan/LPS O-acetylase OafA/YrhL
MGKPAAWLCIIGGMLWGLKPVADVMVHGRRFNQGYVPSNPADYLYFLCPLLCIGALAFLHARFRKGVRMPAFLLLVSLLLTSAFQFSEVYFFGSGIPFGLLFQFTGTVIMAAGAAWLLARLRKREKTGWLAWPVFSLFLVNALLVVFAFASEAMPASVLSPVMAGLIIAVGFLWAAVGLSVLRMGANPGRIS